MKLFFLLGILIPAVLCRPSLTSSPFNWYDDELIEGDIIPSPDRPIVENGDMDEYTKWPNGEIPYDFEGEWTDGQREILQRAFDYYKANSCIRFREKKPEDRDYITFTKRKTGCSSNVGRMIWQQYVNLHDNCFYSFGTVLHELLHAIGFHHEHNRPERDDYIIIHYENIMDGTDRAFKKEAVHRINNYGVSYDYGSVMHYDAYAFSKNGQPTIESKTPNVNMGQREGLSEKDILKIKLRYENVCPKDRL